MERIAQTLNDYIVREFLSSKPGATLGNDEPLIEDGVIDSLGIFMLVAFIEQEFGLKLQPEDVILENFKTVNTIGSLVASRQCPVPQNQL